MKRSAPIRRGKPPARKTRVKSVNRKRKARNTERAYGIATGKRAWIVEQPCVICGVRPCDPAHARTGGVGRKADARELVPLCGPHWQWRLLGIDEVLNEGHHREAHRGVKSFEAKYGVNLLALAAQYEAAWQAHQGAPA